MQIISDTEVGGGKEAEVTPLMLLYQVPAAGCLPQHPLPLFGEGFSTFPSWQTSP